MSVEKRKKLLQSIMDDLVPNPNNSIECQMIHKIEKEDLVLGLVTNGNDDFPRGSVVLLPVRYITNVTPDGHRIFIQTRRILGCTKKKTWLAKVGNNQLG